MVSRKRAQLEANALMKDARVEREREAARSTRFLVLWFPALSASAPSRRRKLLQAARERSGRSAPALVTAVAVVVLTVAWLVALVADWAVSSALLWAALGTLCAGHLIQHWQTRLELRKLLDAAGPEA